MEMVIKETTTVLAVEQCMVRALALAAELLRSIFIALRSKHHPNMPQQPRPKKQVHESPTVSI